MTLPSSGPLSLSDIQSEFGGSNPISLSEYYAGGGLVPSGTTGTYGAVPSSGTISIRNFYGTSNIPALAVTGGTTSVSGSSTRSGAGSKVVTTSSASAGTVSGGVTPYSYLWQYVSGDTFTVNSSTISSTTFSVTITVGLGQSVTKSGVYRCRVTDNVGTIVYGPNCTVEATLSETS